MPPPAHGHVFICSQIHITLHLECSANISNFPSSFHPVFNLIIWIQSNVFTQTDTIKCLYNGQQHLYSLLYFPNFLLCSCLGHISNLIGYEWMNDKSVWTRFGWLWWMWILQKLPERSGGPVRVCTCSEWSSLDWTRMTWAD